MTKISKFNPNNVDTSCPSSLNPITPVKLLSELEGGKLLTAHHMCFKPEIMKQWDNIMLISTREAPDFDTFMAWNNRNPNIIYIYLGHWNDGVVTE